MSEPWAHSGGHLLVDHLNEVAALAAAFSRQLDATGRSSQWAYLAGLWHDLGEYRSYGNMFAFLIVGHHVALGDWKAARPVRITLVNAVRVDILRQCCDKAVRTLGFSSLNRLGHGS